ncbi:NACHT domain-containing protein [Streptomyces barringtoniae]|uniref:NACHT domain-containing protein n=1 Tax=Streptomyces barringtoniae TaxID=2892029 RepID=UPI001E2EB359|nr:NACHT domain-containing protein [Streptomyces barringtoniae]MCC5480471.1 NACHT domain-containing protein [Streptomyces barringtoniae]
MLVVLGAAGALALAQRFHLGTAATAASVLLSLASAYIAWAAFRADRAEATAVELGAIAGQLAEAVKNQWDDEAAVRRVNDPYPLPVAWRAADDDLAEPWQLLTDLACALPGGPPGDPALWPRRAAGLSGQGADIGEVFAERVPTRRLVLLGEPGAGKSVLLIRLLQDLIARRTEDAPVPVLFSLASWNPDQPLKPWMAEQLRSTYPGLRAPAPHSAIPATDAANRRADLAEALLHAGRILPLLDGLDELPPALHATALSALNGALPAQRPLVLASRAAPYRAVLRHPDAPVRLNGAAVIQLRPLAPDTATAYLRRDAGGPHTTAARRWDAVTAHLGTASPVGQALSTPLGLFLARTIYNPRPHSSPNRAIPHPDELCDTIAFPDRTAVDTHLFNAFLPAAYTPGSPHPPRWTAEQAHRSLVFLARFLQNQQAGSPDLAWWKLPHAVSPHLRRLTSTLMFGIASGCTLGVEVGLDGGLVPGLVIGIAGGLVIGLLAAFLVNPAPGTRLRWSPRRTTAGFLSGLAGGFVIGYENGSKNGLSDGLSNGLGTGLTLALLTGIAFSLKAEVPDLTTVTGPVTLLSSDRRAFIATTLAGGLAGVLAGALAVTIGGLQYGLVAVTTTLGTLGLACGLGIGLTQTAWPHFVIVRTHLALRRKLPWKLIGFLQDAHKYRGVLRQAGPMYQFRHIDLQRHLAQQQLP